MYNPKRQFPKKLEDFLNFINIEDTKLLDLCIYHKAKLDTEWL